MKGKKHLIGNIKYVKTDMSVNNACNTCVFNDKSNHDGANHFECDKVREYTKYEYNDCPALDGSHWVEKSDNYEIY